MGYNTIRARFKRKKCKKGTANNKATILTQQIMEM